MAKDSDDEKRKAAQETKRRRERLPLTKCRENEVPAEAAPEVPLRARDLTLGLVFPKASE